MENTIANQNAKRLAALSTIFCIANEIPDNADVARAFAGVVMANINKWYTDNGRDDFDPSAELICDDAITAAFARVQEIAILASISAQTGIGMDGFND